MLQIISEKKDGKIRNSGKWEVFVEKVLNSI